MQKRIKEITSRFEAVFGNTDGLRYFAAPGRVNLIGEHIDYCGGFVFPAALTLDTLVAARPNGTRKLRMAATTLDGIYEADLDNIDEAQTLSWGNYQAGVAKELMADGCKLGGLDMLYMVTVPFGSGLSSSASIELATGIALSSIFNCGKNNIELSLIGQRAENKFCGVNCGIMDQFASGMGKENHAILLNCADLDYKYVPVSLGDNLLVLANTNKKHKLGESKYNERRAEVEAGLKIMQAAEVSEGCAPSDVKKDLCSYTVDDFNVLKHYIKDEIIAKRVAHVISENERVKVAVETLQKGDLVKFGEIMREANQSIRYLYEATGDELDVMYDAAQGLDYCIGSRMTGGGFGGCTVNIVNKDHIEEFKSVVGKKYNEATGNEALFYVCEIGNGAREVFC